MAGEPLVTIVGNLTADPETRDAGTQKVTSFTIAQTPRVKSGDGFEDGEPTFFRASVWGELGLHCAATLTKGSRVIALGGMRTRSYEKDGQTRSSVELNVEAIGPELRFATATVERAQAGGQQRGGQRPPAGNGNTRQQAQPAQPQWSSGGYDDETPF